MVARIFCRVLSVDIMSHHDHIRSSFHCIPYFRSLVASYREECSHLGRKLWTAMSSPNLIVVSLTLLPRMIWYCRHFSQLQCYKMSATLLKFQGVFRTSKYGVRASLVNLPFFSICSRVSYLTIGSNSLGEAFELVVIGGCVACL